jgi:hypothetical protein
MKLSRLIMLGSAAMLAISTTWIVSSSPAGAQESDQSTVSQASDVWGNQGAVDSSNSSDAQAAPDPEVTPDVAAPINSNGTMGW